MVVGACGILADGLIDDVGMMVRGVFDVHI